MEHRPPLPGSLGPEVFSGPAPPGRPPWSILARCRTAPSARGPGPNGAARLRTCAFPWPRTAYTHARHDARSDVPALSSVNLAGDGPNADRRSHGPDRESALTSPHQRLRRSLPASRRASESTSYLGWTPSPSVTPRGSDSDIGCRETVLERQHARPIWRIAPPVPARLDRLAGGRNA